MSEKALRKMVARKLKGHISQIESHETAAGIPDTNIFHVSGQDHWIELKYGTPKKLWHVRPTQKTWMRRRVRSGAKNVWILWRYEETGSVEHGVINVRQSNIEAVLRDVSLESWRSQSLLSWTGETREDALNNIFSGDMK